jgi:hypothetical protein
MYLRFWTIVLICTVYFTLTVVHYNKQIHVCALHLHSFTTLFLAQCNTRSEINEKSRHLLYKLPYH